MATGRRCAWIVLVLLTGCASAPVVVPVVEPSSRNEGDVTCAPGNGDIELPSGFCAIVFADRLGKARHLAVRDNGDVFVAIQGRKGGIVALRDVDGDGAADVRESFGGLGGTGIDIHDGYLYFSPDVAVVRFALGDALVPASAPEIIVGGFPEQKTHAAKPFVFDGKGNLYVNIGAPSNACQEVDRAPGAPGQDPCPLLEGYGGIWQYRADGLEQHYRQGNRYATGIRNAMALDWNDEADRLFVVQHGRDQLSEIFPRLYDDRERAELPAEEMFAVDDGDDFGWPYCYYDHLKGKKVLGPEYGGDGKRTGRCSNTGEPVVHFPAHWAPNDLVFYDGVQFPARFRGGAFVAFHGSWNRQPFEQQGYQVAFVPFVEGLPAGAHEIFADGFAGVRDLRSPQEARYRPTGLAVSPDGSLYVADSVRGRIWRIFYRGQ